ncbi:GGDEF domain-containing protein [Fulvimarina endophytica]|uniref:diguanylate cyclase n=1 Tax=Fulvimarina endophytica TaxID=2293836 RepID=A0A371X7F6_9HYPH|nr:GGDEF domain-containing protein [Fulvimarina endophytica]
MLEVLLRQEGESDPEIRDISLKTLIDSPALSLMALAWTQLSWLYVFWVTGWVWISVFVILYCGLWAVRWPLVRGTASLSGREGAYSDVRLVSANVAMIAVDAAQIFVFALVPDEHASILAIFLTLGFSSYVVSFFPAFPILAMLKIVLLNGALAIGLAVGSSDLMRPIAVLVLVGVWVFWLMIQRTHLILLGAIRNQQTHRRLALLDPLTKLPNRTALWDALDQHMRAMEENAGTASMAILCLDLDGFKQVNDRFGHSAGDWVLVHVANILSLRLTEGGIVCRIGGDEYVVLLPNADEARVHDFSQFVIGAVARPLDIGRSAPVRIGVSIGAFVARDCSLSAQAMLEQADLALYAAKKNGRGQLHVSEPPDRRSTAAAHGEATDEGRSSARLGRQPAV